MRLISLLLMLVFVELGWISEYGVRFYNGHFWDIRWDLLVSSQYWLMNLKWNVVIALTIIAYVGAMLIVENRIIIKRRIRRLIRVGIKGY